MSSRPYHDGHTGIGLARGLAAVARSQMHSGEIPVFRRDGSGYLAYCLCPLLSTLGHDTLAIFDPTSRLFDRSVAAFLPPMHRLPALATATMVRRKIRDFLAWQQHPDGRWSFFGRSSGLSPDAATTACAATVILESQPPEAPDPWDKPPPPAAPKSWKRHVDALDLYRAADGRYFTYIDPHGRGYSSITPEGLPRSGFDRVVNAHVLRFLALAGEDTRDLRTYLMAEAEAGDFRVGSPDHPNPLAFFHAVARAWHQAELPGLEDLAELLVPRILDLQHLEGDFGGPLSTALAILALADLDCRDEHLLLAGAALADQATAGATWGYESYLGQGSGSASFTTCASLAALARVLGTFGTLEPSADITSFDNLPAAPDVHLGFGGP